MPNQEAKEPSQFAVKILSQNMTESMSTYLQMKFCSLIYLAVFICPIAIA